MIYTSDQGFFLGDHGWYDKRFMYEESLRMPFIVRYPAEIKSGIVTDAMALNVDFRDYADIAMGIAIPDSMQGFSLRPLFNGTTPADWRTSMYYRYWMHLDENHNVYAHYGIRTHRYELIYYYAQALGTSGSVDESRRPEWELFDLDNDPLEVNNVYGHTTYAAITEQLKQELRTLQHDVRDVPVHEVE